MTYEEAILHMILRREDLKNSVGDLDEDIKAFDIAIKALELTQTGLLKDCESCRAEKPNKCDDAISRQAAIDAIVAGEPYDMEYNLKMIRQLPSVRVAEKTWHWIPFTKRSMTDEEREYYKEWSDIEGAEIFDCPLPEDGQEVLVSYGDYVYVDVFRKDDGCYFEGVDIDDVDAWMPLLQPYKAESEDAE